MAAGLDGAERETYLSDLAASDFGLAAEARRRLAAAENLSDSFLATPAAVRLAGTAGDSDGPDEPAPGAALPAGERYDREMRGRGRHGTCDAGLRPPARPVRGAQAPHPRGSGDPAPLPRRGTRPGTGAAPQCAGNLRQRRARRPALHRDALRRRRHPGRGWRHSLAGAQGTAPRPGRRRAPRRPPRRPAAPRCQAFERPRRADARRRPQGPRHRFRPRHRPRRCRRNGRGRRLAPVHRAGTPEHLASRGRPPLGHLQPGDHHLPAAHRQAPVHRAGHGRHPAPGPRSGSAAAAPAPADPAGGARSDHPALHRPRSRPALCLGAGRGRGPPALSRRRGGRGLRRRPRLSPDPFRPAQQAPRRPGGCGNGEPSRRLRGRGSLRVARRRGQGARRAAARPGRAAHPLHGGGPAQKARFPGPARRPRRRRRRSDEVLRGGAGGGAQRGRAPPPLADALPDRRRAHPARRSGRRGGADGGIAGPRPAVGRARAGRRRTALRPRPEPVLGRLRPLATGRPHGGAKALRGLSRRLPAPGGKGPRQSHVALGASPTRTATSARCSRPRAISMRRWHSSWPPSRTTRSWPRPSRRTARPNPRWRRLTTPSA